MLLTTDKRGILLRSRDPEKITAIIPRSKRVDVADHNVLVYNGVDEVKVLRNLGVKVPSPISTAYNWPGIYTPLAHQIKTAAFIVDNHRGFVLNEMGTMKTASALWAIDYLISSKATERVLIVAPLSTLEQVWYREAFQLLTHRQSVLLYGSAAQRKARFESDWEIGIINFDGLRILHKEIKADKRIRMVVIDEAAAYRDASTQRYAVLQGMLRADMRLVLMTGTPCPNAPTDAWALARLVNPARVPKYFGSFRDATMMKVTNFKWAPKPDGYKSAYAAMQPAVRFRKSECLDLPPVSYQSRACEITAEQKRAYQSMRKSLVADTQGVQITAVHAADKLNKLRQILCGVVKDTQTGEYVTLDYKPRLQLLLECIAEAGGKTIVVVPFKGIINSLAEKVSEHYTCAIVNGDVSIAKRNEIFRQFREQPDPHVLLCHPKVMAHGLTLTEASTMVFFAPIYSNEEYQQVTERINRPGQKNKMTIIKIAASSTELGIYKAVEDKKTGQDHVLDLYKQAIAEF